MGSHQRSAFFVVSVAAILALALPAAAQPLPFELPVCRDAGFWQTHAGTEKGSPNITQAVIDEAGGCIEVCGEVIDETSVDSADSALEGLCASPKAGGQIQLARQLLAAALSCVFSVGNPDCLEGSSYCEEACADGINDSDDSLCLSYLQCTTAGGSWGGPGVCLLGTCSISGLSCGIGYPPCDAGQTCVPLPGNCAKAPLVNDDLDFDPTPSASSSKACNNATKSACTIVGPKEANCASGESGTDPEECTCPDATCGSPTVCNEGQDCFNFQTPEEACGVCSHNLPCDVPSCTASSDCGPGGVCVINTCCGAGGVCTTTCTPQ